MGFDSKKKKVAVAGFASLLLVAMVIGVAVSVTKKSDEGGAAPPSNGNTGSISASTKAVKAICSPTDYKETCEESLSKTNTTDPKELIKVAFDATVKNIGDVIKNSSLLQEAAKDSRTKEAFNVCKEVLETSIEDLKRSFDKVGEFDASKIDEYVSDVKTWLSGAITNQETCIDAFENTTGDTGEKMKKLLKTASELSSNGLAMVSDFSQIFASLQLGGFTTSRRLLTEDNKYRLDYSGDEIDVGWATKLKNKDNAPPSFVSPKARRLSGDEIDEGWATKLKNKDNDLPSFVSPKARRLSDDEIDVGWATKLKNKDNAPPSFVSPKARRLSDDEIDVGWATKLKNKDNAPPSFVSPKARRLSDDEIDVGWATKLKNKDNDLPSFVSPKARRLMAATPANVKINAIVAQDGSGQFKTISAAINSIPAKNNQTFVIYVKEGHYKEYVSIPKKVNNVVLMGDGPLKTIISGGKNYADGVQTFHTATLAVNADSFIAKDIAIENTAGPTKHQAVAVRVSGDKAIFYNVKMDGYQDTLYAHTYRQYYRGCTISGTIDFIFGDATAIFQNCQLTVRKPMDNQACMVTAQGRKDHRSVGAIVLQNCNIVAEPQFTQVQPALKAYLGRPWKEYSRTIIMQSNIDAFISPEGWAPWMGTFALDTLYYAEYQNRGPGSNMSGRVKWKGIKKITPQIAESFTPGKIYGGDEWIKAAAIPYTPGMINV